MPKDLWCSRAVGSWSAPLLGSTAAEDLPRIGRTSIARRSHSCASLQSASCSENFVIRLDVPGQTLSFLQRLRISSNSDFLISLLAVRRSILLLTNSQAWVEESSV